MRRFICGCGYSGVSVVFWSAVLISIRFRRHRDHDGRPAGLVSGMNPVARRGGRLGLIEFRALSPVSRALAGVVAAA